MASRRPVRILVGVGLMADVPDEPVVGRIEDRMNRNGELRRPQRAREMTARLRDGLNHERAKLLGELRELMHVEPAQVRRRADGFEKRLLSHLGAAYRGWGHFSENARSRSRRSGQGGQPRLRERRDRSRRVRARRGRGRAVHEPARGAPSRPRSDTQVGLSSFSSFPAVLPSVAVSCVQSRMSSTTWKATPSASA